MPWNEDGFRRALEGTAERARPSPDALAKLRVRMRARRRLRAVGMPVGATAALILAALILRQEPATRDVEFAEPFPTPAATSTAPPVISEEADGGSILAEISADGRFVVFMSEASNLVPDDTNRVADTFVRDLSTGAVERVSLSSSSAQGNAGSFSASISRDGRFVAFRSRASNLVEGDTNGVADIFVRDRTDGTTVRASVGADGAQANGDSDSASISGDGRLVAFRSAASNLVEGDTNQIADIFVRDLGGETTERASVSSAGTQSNGDSRNPQIATNGSRIVFASEASSLVDGDTNRTWDVFTRGISNRRTERVSVSSDGLEGRGTSAIPAISGDGRVVGFVSDAPNLVPGDTNRVRDAFIRDLGAATTERVSVPTGGGQANRRTLSVALSGDGRFVALSSDASNLVATDRNVRRDIFVLDRSSGIVTLASVASDGTAADADSGGPSISADGRDVAFQSFADSLAAGDQNEVRDVFVHDLATTTTSRVSAGRR